MDISVIIPAFNEARYLPGTLESIQRASNTCGRRLKLTWR